MSVEKVFLCPFLCKASPSGVILEFPGFENIPQVPGNRSEIVQNHEERKAVSATLSVLKLSGARFRPRISKPSIRSFYLCVFLCKPRPSGVSLESPGLENIPQFPKKPPKVAQNHDARSAVSATVPVLKVSGAIFWPRSWKPSLRSFYLCPFLCKPTPGKVSLESPGLENIPRVPGNPAKVAQNHDARKTVSATLSVSSVAIFRPRNSKVSVHKVSLSPFHCKARP